MRGVVAGLDSDQQRHQWRLQLQSVWGSVQSEGELATATPFAVKANYHYTGQLIADIPQVSVQGNVSGDLVRLRVRADSVHQEGKADAPALANKMTAQLAVEVSPFAVQALGPGQVHIKNLNPRWLNASAPQALLDIDVDVRPLFATESTSDDKKVDGRSLKLHLTVPEKKPDAHAAKKEAASLVGTIVMRNTAPGSLDQEGLPFKQFSAEAQWAGRSLKISNARLSLLEGLIEGHAQSDFSVLAQAQLNAKLSVKEVNLARIDSRLHPSSIKGQIQVQTREQAKGQRQIDFQAQLTDPLANLRADATLTLGDAPQLQLKTVELSSDQSQLKGQAELSWADQHEFKMQGKLTQFDPSRWMKAPKGRIDGEFVAAGSWHPDWQVRLSVPHVSGELAGQTLTGVAQLQWQGDRLLKVDQMQWQWGRNTLQVNGSLGGEKDEMRLSLSADELNVFNSISPRHLNGRANVQATLRGKLMAPSVEAQAQAEDVQWGSVAKFAYLKASASIGAGQQAAMNVQVQAQQLRWNLEEGSGSARPANSLREFSASLQGTRSAHQLAMQAQWDGGQALSMKASGKFDVPDWNAPAWSGRLDAVQLTGVSASAGGEISGANVDLALREPGWLSWSRDKLAVSQLNLQGQLGQINVDQLEWTPRSLSTIGRARAFPANVLMKLGKAKERVQGDLTLALDWDVQLKEHLAAKIAVHRQAGDIEVVDADATSQKMPMGMREFDVDLRSAGVVAGSDAEKIELTLNAKGTRLGVWNGKLNSQLRRDGVHWTWDTDMPLAGDLHVQINELQWLASQASSELVGKGQLKMDADFSGKFSRPKYQAKIEGHGLEFAFASEGMLFPNGELKALLTDEVFKLEQLRFTNTLAFVPKIDRFQELNWAGRVGEFDASGEVNWRLQQGAITANWKNFPLLQRKDRWLVVSGQAGITQTDKSWTLAGKLAADAAYFRLPKMPPPSLSNDVLISRELKLSTGDEEAASKFAMKAKFDLQLDMGSRFVFVGRGLDTALSGVMRLRGSESSPVYASGSIATNGGQYEGYGQQLEIERGILKFQGSAFNPALNIRALRKGLPVEAGVDVTGTVANPQVRLVSEPNVPDNEKVSWLVLGRGLDQFAAADASLLLSAAGAILGGDGSRNIPRELAQGLGFDEFSIGPAESGGSSKLPNQTVAGAISAGSTSNDQVVSIGKRFKPGIVLSVERGVSDASNALKLSWQLGRRIRLIGRKGTDDAVDVKYSFSFN
ncbi:MAG: translocation/assembly module TamB domain-containing protein [Burkholderiales bacterium]|nr:translocation/assembly module TamB domain-containing protein [Burkholderiales bacterium]